MGAVHKARRRPCGPVPAPAGRPPAAAPPTQMASATAAAAAPAAAWEAHGSTPAEQHVEHSLVQVGVKVHVVAMVHHVHRGQVLLEVHVVSVKDAVPVVVNIHEREHFRRHARREAGCCCAASACVGGCMRGGCVSFDVDRTSPSTRARVQGSGACRPQRKRKDTVHVCKRVLPLLPLLTRAAVAAVAAVANACCRCCRCCRC
eukprot:365622-Chlamydomonas_euryale.AAC.3